MTASAAAPLLSVRDLRIDLSLPGRERRILDDISFDVAPREIVGVVGASGAGKTVLSRAVAVSHSCANKSLCSDGMPLSTLLCTVQFLQ